MRSPSADLYSLFGKSRSSRTSVVHLRVAAVSGEKEGVNSLDGERPEGIGNDRKDV